MMMMVLMVKLTLAKYTVANASPSAIDVVLKRENTPHGFDRSEAKGYKRTEGYKCYAIYLCKQLAESTQSENCINNAEIWALLYVLLWLTRMKSRWHWTSGEAIRREGSVPGYLPYTRRQDRNKEVVKWFGKTLLKALMSSYEW